MSDITERLSLVEDLTELLDKNETEIQQFTETLDVWMDIKEITRKQQELMKKDIKMLCSIVEEEKHNISLVQKELEDKYLDKEKELQQQKKEAEQNKVYLQEEHAVLQKEMAQVEKLKSKLEQEKETIENNTTKVLPKVKYDLNLYNMICRIRWQYDCSPEDISGYVCNKGDVKPFSLNRKQNSQFFITNYLWDLIEEGGPTW